jgi:hypothetical protein
LKEKLAITITRKLATFLHPKEKSLNTAENEEVKAKARRLISMKSRSKRIKILHSLLQKENINRGKFRRVRGFIRQYSFFSCNNRMSMIMMGLVSKYKSKKIQSIEIFHLLAKWCQQQQEEFSRLNQVSMSFMPS